VPQASIQLLPPIPCEMDLPVLRVSGSVVVYAGDLPLCRLEPALATPPGPAPNEAHEVPDVIMLMAKIADGRLQTHASKAKLSKRQIQSYIWAVQVHFGLRKGLGGQWNPSADARLITWLLRPARTTNSKPPLALEPPPALLALADEQVAKPKSDSSSDSSSSDDEAEGDEQAFENNFEEEEEEENGEDEEQNAMETLQARVTDLENDLGSTCAELEVADLAVAHHGAGEIQLRV
jgi:hypothetical protein